MSLLRRKRRQNRLKEQFSPATRDMRLSLESLSEVRGLRFGINRDLIFELPERKRSRTVIQSPYDLAKLDVNREVKQAVAINGHKGLGLKGYNDIRKAQSKFAVKPLYTIKPDMSIKVDLPPEHPICIQREKRREVLFALGKSGRGGQRPRRLDNNITLRCR